MSDIDIIYSPRRPTHQSVTSIPAQSPSGTRSNASHSPQRVHNNVTTTQPSKTSNPLHSTKSVFDRIYDQIVHSNAAQRATSLDEYSSDESDGGNQHPGSRIANRNQSGRPRHVTRVAAPAQAAASVSTSVAHAPTPINGQKTPFRVTNMGSHQRVPPPQQQPSTAHHQQQPTLTHRQEGLRDEQVSPIRNASPQSRHQPRYADPTAASSQRSTTVTRHRRRSSGADRYIAYPDDEAEIEAMVPINASVSPIRKLNGSGVSLKNMPSHKRISATETGAPTLNDTKSSARVDGSRQQISTSKFPTSEQNTKDDIIPINAASSEISSPLRHLSRQQLAEQLTTYATAYVDERDAHEAAEARLAELSYLADTSTSMAEESDRNCKLLLEKLDSTEQQLSQVSGRLRVTLEENRQLSHALEESQRREVGLEQRFSAMQQGNTGLEKSLLELQRSYEQLKLESQQHQQEVLTLKAKHELALQTAAVKYESESDHLKQSVTRLEREVKELRDGIADLESSHQRERKDAASKLADAYADVDKFRAAAETLRIELRAVADSAETERTSHVRQEQVYLTEVETLKGRVAALTGQYEQCFNRKNELEREMVAVRDSHNAMTVKVKTTLAELETTDAEKESRRMLERQNLEMEKQILDLRATLQTFITTRRVQ